MNWKFQLTSVVLFMLNTSLANANKIDYYVIAEQARPFQIETKGADHSGIVTDIVKEVSLKKCSKIVITSSIITLIRLIV